MLQSVYLNPLTDLLRWRQKALASGGWKDGDQILGIQTQDLNASWGQDQGYRGQIKIAQKKDEIILIKVEDAFIFLFL
ncbi:MAG: hypothetical protein H7A33_07575 [Deltaproteobacteria bacterium]|nr:hypothetical protein [Deltaproteobacteria bacterium]